MVEYSLALANNIFLLVHSEEDAVWIGNSLLVALLDQFVVFECDLLMFELALEWTQTFRCLLLVNLLLVVEELRACARSCVVNKRLSSCAPDTFDGFADDRLRVLVVLFLWLDCHMLHTSASC